MIRRKVMGSFFLFCVVAMLFMGCGETDSRAQENKGMQEAAQDSTTEKQPQDSDGIKEGNERKENQDSNEKAEAEENRPQIPSFIAKDLDGNMVTETIFTQKDLTVVNVWGTFCPPCIGEMPELGEWAKEMPENVQIVGLIVDIEGDEDTQHHDLAVEITEKAEAEFTQIIANRDFGWLLGEITGVPTTFFVDKEGCIVGNAIVGANVDRYKEAVEGYLNGQ